MPCCLHRQYAGKLPLIPGLACLNTSQNHADGIQTIEICRNSGWHEDGGVNVDEGEAGWGDPGCSFQATDQAVDRGDLGMCSCTASGLVVAIPTWCVRVCRSSQRRSPPPREDDLAEAA